MAVDTELGSPKTLAKTRGRRYRPWLLGVVLALALSAGAAVVLLAVNWPFTQQALIDVLQERTVRSVTIGRFRMTYFPPGCVAEKISFLHRKHKNKPPLITIDRLVVSAGYWGMIGPHKRLSQVRVSGLHVTVPPSDPNGEPNPVMPLTNGTPGPPLVIGTVVADGAILDFLQRTPGKPPVRLVIDKLLLDNVGNNLPLDYRAEIENPNPPGLIQSAGRFGVWDTSEPARTPVNGWYRFGNANLGVYKMISGTLRSSGRFNGALGAIAVKGSADVPDFHVADTAHTRDLQAQFDAVISATDGNVDLNSVTARFDHTTLSVTGSVQGEPKEPGKAVSLMFRSTSARIEDLLFLVIEAPRAPMTGNTVLEARVTLPQGAKSFLRDMRVDGNFRVAPGRFTNPEIEQDLARISRSAAPKDGLPPPPPDAVRSDLSGAASVRNAVAHLSNLRLTIPGAAATLDGSYSLVDYSMDLHGSLQTAGSPGAVTTGFKSLMLSGLTPFLKKKDGRRVIPFKIGGSYHNAKADLDLGHKSTPPR